MNENDVNAVAVLIPVVAIIMGVGIAMFSLNLQYRKKRDMLQHYHAERMAAIDKGIELPPLPPQLLQAQSCREFAPARHRRIGLILLFLGLALAIALWGTGSSSYWWGLVPAAVGLAYLIAGALEAREVPAVPREPTP